MTARHITRTPEQNGLDSYTAACRAACREGLAEGNPRRIPSATRQAHIWMYRAKNDQANAGLYAMEQRALGLHWPPALMRFTVGPTRAPRFFSVPLIRRRWYR
jgi:hypothetical protein